MYRSVSTNIHISQTPKNPRLWQGKWRENIARADWLPINSCQKSESLSEWAPTMVRFHHQMLLGVKRVCLWTNLNMLNWSQLNLNHPSHQNYISTNKITCIPLSRKNAKKSRTVSILSPKALSVSPSNHYVLTMCNQYFMIPSTRSYVGNASFWRGSYFFKSSTRSTANPPCLCVWRSPLGSLSLVHGSRPETGTSHFPWRKKPWHIPLTKTQTATWTTWESGAWRNPFRAWGSVDPDLSHLLSQ